MDSDDIKKSKFNAGVAHAERIDALQRAINVAKFNPLGQNGETGTFNYQVMMSGADCLVAEGWEKFTPKEKIVMAKMTKIMKGLHKHFPPMDSDRHGQLIINQKNYEGFLNFFEIYERKLKELYGEHHLNSPSKDEDDGDYDY